MALIGRDLETARLRRATDHPPELVVLRGRRRVGKSYLMANALGDRRQVSLQADEQDEAHHLALLAREAAGLIPGAPPLHFPDWDAALGFLGDQAGEEPLVVVLDEFQWLLEAQPALDSILQRHWDHWQRAGTQLTLVLCGSALTLMERLLGHGSPLFGRAGYRPLLQPLDFRAAVAFAGPGASPEELLRRFAVLGGTPQYQVWAGPDPVRDLIAERILTPGEPLYEEPLHLLREERTIRSPGPYFSVVRAIADGAGTHGEIANQAHVDTPTLSKILPRLMELGYVQLGEPVTIGGRAGRGTYRLSDPFFRFWFRFVFPNRSRLERGRVKEVLAEVESRMDDFMGPAFEDCCRSWAGRYAEPEEIPALDAVGGWWDRRGRTEIDVVGVAGRRYELLGSCKWSQRARASTLADLEQARETLGPAARDAELVIFARGFHPGLEQRAERGEVRLVGAAQLVSGGGVT